LSKRAKSTRVILLDPTDDEGVMAEALKETESCETVAVAAYATVSAYRGNVALPGSFAGFLNQLAASKPVALVSLGNPYLLRSFPNVAAYMCSFSPAPTSEAAVAKALLGDIPVTGRMPVSIPGFAKIGDGIQLGVMHPMSSK
jgi:beta-N-acetylhexosaminidase